MALIVALVLPGPAPTALADLVESCTAGVQIEDLTSGRTAGQVGGEVEEDCAAETLPKFTVNENEEPMDPVNVVFKGDFNHLHRLMHKNGWEDMPGWCSGPSYVQWNGELKPYGHTMDYDDTGGCGDRFHIRFWTLDLVDGTVWSIGAVHYEHLHCCWHHKVHSFEDSEAVTGETLCGEPELEVEFDGYFTGYVQKYTDHDENVFSNDGYALRIKYVRVGGTCTGYDPLVETDAFDDEINGAGDTLVDADGVEAAIKDPLGPGPA